MNTGFFKHKKNIIEIEILDNIILKYPLINPLYAHYKTRSFKILNIYDMNNNKYNINKKYEINKIYHENKIYFKLYTQAYLYNFIKNKDYLYISKNYYCLYEEYYKNGQLYKKIFYLNNIKVGSYEQWFYNGIKKIECNYINNKKQDKKEIIIENR